MLVGQIIDLLEAVPVNSRVYFKIPEGFTDGDEVGVAVFKYNAITNEVVLEHDCQANYD